jgi:tetratricopeptide (TPR) repeat protein
MEWVEYSKLAPMGSISDISSRLLLWTQRSAQGLARVEFSSDFSRQRVVNYLKGELAKQQIPLTEIQLPPYREPMEIVDYLLAELDKQPEGVVSIHGFSTAFRSGVPLQDAMLALNFNRERFAEHPRRQIWWMTPAFYDAAQFAMPDLMSWFSPRLRLTEAVAIEPQGLAMKESTANIDDAYQRAKYLIQRFEQGQAAGASAEELLKFNLLPALEALAEVNAQKELRDLTSQFEGFFSNLQTPDCPELATSLDRLGRLYLAQGRYGEAEPLLQKALRLRCRLLDKEHPDVAASLNNLAGLYKSQGRYPEAEPLFQRSLNILEQQLGENHPDVASSLNNLAILYQSQGRYPEAEPLFLQSLSIRKRQLGENHPDVANSLNNLADLYYSQGRYSEAEPLFQRSLTIREQQLGENHPDVAIGLNNLAGLYYSQGRYPEAEPLFQRSLSIRERQLGENHPDVASSLNNLAILYQSQGRYPEAEPLFQQSLSIRERQLGENHPDVANSLNNLADLYYSQSRYSEAESLYLKGLIILFQFNQQQSGFEHPNFQTVLKNFYDFIKQVIQAGQQTVLSDHPITQNLLSEVQANQSPD